MGSHSVKPIDESRNAFTTLLLKDIEAMDIMLSKDMFERGHQRIGAEQELALIRSNGLPSTCGPDLLDQLPEQFTTEIGKYNLEINLDPYELDAEAFHKTEAQLRKLMGILEKVAHEKDTAPLMTGILPTFKHHHLEEDYMTPMVRYKILSDAIYKLRGASFEINIQGADELIARLDSVMYEACNTSWQLHLQLHPEEFVERYNWAQYIAGPVLAVTANSPLLFGRELWHETRIALFQQSIDTRSSSNHLRDKRNRVGFGNNWLRDSPSAIFKDNITRFPSILMGENLEDAIEALDAGRIPKLKALRLHNGTVYTWNRPCYGISDTGYPHLRIENRYIPSGPTISDAMANFMFWVGLMKGMPEKYSLLSEEVPFQVVKDNFYRAARSSLFSVFNWNGKEITASRLILEELIPIAMYGLQKIGVAQSAIEKNLDIIERRAKLKVNGATWMISNFRNLTACFGKGVAVQELTQALLHGQRSGLPIHEWGDIDCEKVYDLSEGKTTVGRLMKTDLFTVNQEEPLSLVKAVMKWKKIRHIPVENDEGQLVGLVTRTNIESVEGELGELKVKDFMVTKLVTAEQNLSLNEAALLIKQHKVGCLPVIRNKKLTGILTDTDFRKLYGSDY
jgi:CBS domain-containing protein